MHVTIEDVGSVKKKLNIEVSAERVSKEIDRCYADIQKKAAIKGFRKGKAPMSQIVKFYESAMQEDVVKKLFQDTYYAALNEHNIAAVSFPTVEFGELGKNKPLTYTATVEVYPEVTAVDYKGLTVNKEKKAFDEALIENRIQEMRESMSELAPVEDRSVVEKGDFIEMDFDGFIEDQQMDNGSAKDFQLEIGGGKFIPGFEEQLIGVEIGKTSDITVTFPENYHAADIAGKEARFTITVNSIKAKNLPELDNEFASQFGDYETVEDLRNHLKEMFQKQYEEKIESDFRDRLIAALIEKNQIEVPDTMIAHQLEQMLENAKKRLSAQRMTLEMMGMDEQKYKDNFKEVAISQVKGALLLESVANQENITVSDDSINKKIADMAGSEPENVDRLKNYYLTNSEAKTNLTAYIREDLALSFLAESAVISELTAEELQGGAA